MYIGQSPKRSVSIGLTPAFFILAAVLVMAAGFLHLSLFTKHKEATMEAAEYNRRAIGHHFSLVDLPPDWPGFGILEKSDLDEDRELAPYEQATVDWDSFSEAVETFQGETPTIEADGKLGPMTLRALRARFGLAGGRERILTTVGGVEFRPATEPLAEPVNKAPRGLTPMERTAAALWNNYGAAIAKYAAEYKLPVRAALAVFCVESGKAYDPQTGLVMIQYEDHVFSRIMKRPLEKPRYGSQAREWADLARAAEIDAEAAFDATSAGLPQCMGFNAELVGYLNARAMFAAFQASVWPQVEAFFRFVEAAGLAKHVRTPDWYRFARGYNGPGKPGFYAQALETALAAVRGLEIRGAVFGA